MGSGVAFAEGTSEAVFALKTASGTIYGKKVMKEYSAVQLNLGVLVSREEAMLDAFPIEVADLSVVLGTRFLCPLDAKVAVGEALVVRE